jgi:hypothetical protein
LVAAGHPDTADEQLHASAPPGTESGYPPAAPTDTNIDHTTPTTQEPR